MHIRYKGDDLLRASDMLKNGTLTWDELVGTAYDVMKTAYNDETWQGKAAECFKSYYQDIHGSFAVVYFQLTKLFVEKCTAYVADYLTVDGDDHAVIDTDELADVITHIVFRSQDTHAVHNAVNTEISSVSDITSIKYDSNPAVFGQLDKMRTDVTKLQQAVWDEETRFTGDGFPEMKELLDSLIKLINSGNAVKVSSDNRSLAYDPSALKETFKDVAAAYEHAGEYEDAHATEFAKNDKILQDAIDRRQEELNRRKAVAIGVAVVVGVIGAVATVVTCGAAGPATAIAVGAIVGAASSAATSIANQNVGDIYGRGKIDGKEVIKEAVIGGITGAVTSVAGLGSAKLVASAAKIANPVVRVGAKAAIKTVISVGTGMINRGIETGIRKESIKEGWNAAIDGKKIAGDAAGAAVSSIVGDSVDGAYKKLGWDKVAKDKKLVDIGTAALKDQLTDGSKRFAGTLAETGNLGDAAKKTFDLEAAGKTLVQTGVTKATEYYVADQREKFDNKKRQDMNKLERFEDLQKSKRVWRKSSDEEFRKETDIKNERDLTDKYTKMYNDRAKAGNPSKQSKQHYVSRFVTIEENKLKNDESTYFDAARKADDKTVSKQYESMNKSNVGKIYDATADWAKGSETTPQDEVHDARQEDKDHLMNYNH